MNVRLEIAPTSCEALGLDEGTLFVRHMDLAEGETVATLLKRLVTEESRLADSLFHAETGAVTEQVRMILNGVFLDLNGPGLALPVKDGDRLVVVPGGGD